MMEFVILICSLALFSASIVMTFAGGKPVGERKRHAASGGGSRPLCLKKKAPGSRPLGVININGLKEDTPVGIVIYHMTQSAETGIYNRRGEFLQRKNPPDRYA